MSTITKAIADDVTAKLLKPRKDALKISEKRMSDELTRILKLKIPVEILSAFKKHPQYFNTSSQVTVSGNGFDYKRFTIENWLPKKDFLAISPNDNDAEILMAISREIENKEREIRDLRSETYNTLLSLRTFKRVQQSFPEAAVHLPAIKSGVVVVNLESIRKKFK